MHFYYLKPIFLCIQPSDPFKSVPRECLWVDLDSDVLLTYSVMSAARWLWLECICSLCICMLFISGTRARELSNAAWSDGWNPPDTASQKLEATEKSVKYTFRNVVRWPASTFWVCGTRYVNLVVTPTYRPLGGARTPPGCTQLSVFQLCHVQL